MSDYDTMQMFTIPPDGVRVEAGTTETIVLATEAAPDRFYDLRIEVEIVVDGKKQHRTFGTEKEPLRLTTFVPDLGVSVDWDPALRQWISAQQNFDTRRAAELAEVP